MSSKLGQRIITLALMLAAIGGALAAERVISHDLDSQRDDRIAFAEENVSDSLGDRTFYLQDVADMVGVHDDADQKEFSRYARVRGRLDPAVIAVQWLRRSPDGQFVAPSNVELDPVLVPAKGDDADLSRATERAEAQGAIRTASLDEKVATSPPLKLSNGDSGFYIAVPIEAHRFSGEVSSVESESVIVGLVDAQSLLDDAIDDDSDVSVADDTGDLAAVGDEQDNPVTSTIDAHGRQWTISIEGGARSPLERALPWLILIVGLLLTAVTGLLLGRAIKRRDEALRLASERESELERRSRVDELTDAYNRRHFSEQLALELDRGGDALAVLLMDLDHFKRINDERGHLIGDEVLQVTAARISESLRGSEMLARWGGEEFAVLVPRISRDDALALAERLREALAAEPVLVDGDEVPLTMSVGVALAADGLRTADALVGAADRALYEAKDAGRNTVRTAGTSSAPSAPAGSSPR